MSMSNEIEKLPLLIRRAADALAKATTAGEVLDAIDIAKMAADAAKSAARFAKAKSAHDTIVAACHKAMADAFVIEAQAQCRLADEYDAAQARGEVTKRPGPRKQSVPNENQLFSAEDIGLTKKQVHEARKVRDAEKEKPGVIRKALDEQLAAGEEPTRAHVKRAINPKRINRRGQNTPKQDAARKIIREKFEAGESVDPHKLEKEHGISHVTFDMAIAAEMARKETLAEPEIDRAILSMTAQQKFDVALRQARRRLEAEITQRCRAEYRKLLEDVLVDYREKEKHYNIIIAQHKGLMDKTTYNLIWSCLHSDSRKSVTDERLNRAFNVWTNLEKAIVSAKESGTKYTDLPESANGWLKRKAEYQAQKAAERAAKKKNANSMERR